MTYRVLITDSLAPQGMEILRHCADIAVDVSLGLAPLEMQRAVPPYHGLIVRSGTRVTKEVIAAGANLRVIGRAGIGVDNIDIEEATKRGIVVMNTPGGNNVAAAEHTLSLLLAMARYVPQATASLKAGKWERARFTGTEVCNKVLGVIGLGNIGTIVAERAQGFKMKVLAYDPFITPEVTARLKVELVSLDELCRQSDFITVHTPLTQETRGLIGPEAIARMKKGVRIINCARGGIVDEEGLARAIQEGHVAGAALDVFVEEPPPKDHSLLKLDQVICTPHLGAATGEAQISVAVAIAEQIVGFLTRGVIQNAVNVPSLTPEMLTVLRPYLLLGEKLGSFQAQMVAEAPVEVHVEYSGEVVEYEVGQVTAAVLRGLLSPFLEPTVNYVNAPLIAHERGIKVIESRSSRPGDFLNSVTVRVFRATRETLVEGAVFGNKTVRLVRINDFYLEAVPEGYILMLHNRDVPGVVGAVGTLLGQQGINIAGLELGRERIGGMAISLIHVDDPVPPAALTELRTLPHIVSAQLIRL